MIVFIYDIILFSIAAFGCIWLGIQVSRDKEYCLLILLLPITYLVIYLIYMNINMILL